MPSRKLVEELKTKLLVQAQERQELVNKLSDLFYKEFIPFRIELEFTKEEYIQLGFSNHAVVSGENKIVINTLLKKDNITSVLDCIEFSKPCKPVYGSYFVLDNFKRRTNIELKKFYENIDLVLEKMRSHIYMVVPNVFQTNL